METQRILALASLIAGAFLTPAKASIVITALESGGHVVFSFSGSLDLTGAGTPHTGTGAGNFIGPPDPSISSQNFSAGEGGSSALPSHPSLLHRSAISHQNLKS